MERSSVRIAVSRVWLACIGSALGKGGGGRWYRGSASRLCGVLDGIGSEQARWTLEARNAGKHCLTHKRIRVS